MFLLGGMLEAPLRGVLWVVEQMYDRAMQELYDEETVRRQLLELRLQFEMDEIEEPVYVEKEMILLARMRQIRLEKLAELGVITDE